MSPGGLEQPNQHVTSDLKIHRHRIINNVVDVLLLK